MVENATATISSTSIAGGFSYSITLQDTGTTTLGTFWFAWVPGKDFLKTSPLTRSNPSGWSNIITGGNPNNGFAIQWVAGPGAAIQPGGSAIFGFTSADTPAEVFGKSVFYPTTDVRVSFVYSAAPFSDAGFTFTVACYRAGTAILTACGEIPVERLLPGDLLPTASGRLAPLRWLGHRRIDCRRHPTPAAVHPIRVRAHAFGPNSPRRDLYLSPDHAVHLALPGHNPGLVPIRLLENGTTIAPVAVDNVQYFHVELDRHDVIFAEGLPAESYLDTGNRAAFANGGTTVMRDADFALGRWEDEACAQLCLGGSLVTAARTSLAARVPVEPPGFVGVG